MPSCNIATLIEVTVSNLILGKDSDESAPESELAKALVGRIVAFYGGVDVRGLLPFGKPDEIEEEASRLHRLFADTDRYILSTSHVIMDQIPVENALALYYQARGGQA
jgi:uroporphyrinogen decarboxylase